MNLEEKLYYTISEVAQYLDLNPSLLRFWEKEFPDIIKPKKNRNGKRMYTAHDIEAIRQIQHLTKEKGFTLSGAKASLKSDKKAVIKNIQVIETLTSVKHFLMELKQIINH